MTAIKTFIQKRPVLTYSALTFAISWGGMFIAVILGGTPANEEQSAMLLVFSYIAMLIGPSLGGLLLTGVIDGKAGFRELASRLSNWRPGARWYAIAILVTPLLIVATLLALSLTSSDFLPRLFTEEDKAFLLQFSFVAGIMVGVFEELGWTGFVLPKVRLHFSTIKSGIIIGLLYAVWNFPVVFWVSTATGTAGSLPMVIFMPAVLFTWLPACRVLMVWVYEHTESLLLIMLMHASLIAFWRIFTPLSLTGITLVTFYLVFTAAVWIINAVALQQKTLPRIKHA